MDILENDFDVKIMKMSLNFIYLHILVDYNLDLTSVIR
jgi:hypothetical protein